MQARKTLSVLLTLILALAIIPATAILSHAATGMATIDISTLGGADISNSAASATESQWNYFSANPSLHLTTAGGSYTLSGSHTNLGLGFSAANSNITLNGISVTGSMDNITYSIPLRCHTSSSGSTISIAGTNTLTGVRNQAGLLFGNGSSSTCDYTVTGSGSLTVKGAVSAGAAIGLNASDTITLRITGSASITAVGGSGGYGMSFGSTASVLIGDNAKLTMTNNSGSAEEHTFSKADTGNKHQWKLTGATLASGSLTDESISISIAPGTTGTIEREPIPVPPTITTATLPNGTVGTVYSQNLAATGDMPLAWSISSGTLPAGLTLNTSTGVISGTPTTAGKANFTVKATNNAGSATKALAITVAAAPVPPAITTTTPQNGTVGTAYSQTLAATGDTPITWSVASGTLPAGLTLSSAGVISGTPTAAGKASFTVKAMNNAGSATKALTITVAAAPVPPAITTTTLQNGTVGTAYSQTLAATGDTPITWSVANGTLPAGLSLSPAGVISGTPTAAGTANFTVKASNGADNATKALTITIAAAPVVRGIFGTNARWYGAWWHYVLFFLFGFIWMWF